MKKEIVFSSILAVMVIAALVFNFCTKQTETESDVNGVKMHKALPHCFPPAELVQLTLRTGVCINVCIKCDDLKNGDMETCFNLCELEQPCQPYPAGTCCPYPLVIKYNGPKPASRDNLRTPNYWRWGGASAPLPSMVTKDDLLQIVADPALKFCFQ
jgi:hypothetical protein